MSGAVSGAGSGQGCLADNVVRFRVRQDRERYMDSLERQMEPQRPEIQRTLDRLEGPGRRRAALEKLRSFLPSIPGRSSVRYAGKRERGPEESDRAVPRSGASSPQEGVQRRWWEFWR